MVDIADLYLAKARASLAGARSELEQHRFDNAANRAYYACFQAAIYALLVLEYASLAATNCGIMGSFNRALSATSSTGGSCIHLTSVGISTLS